MLCSAWNLRTSSSGKVSEQAEMVSSWSRDHSLREKMTQSESTHNIHPHDGEPDVCCFSCGAVVGEGIWRGKDSMEAFLGQGTWKCPPGW